MTDATKKIATAVVTGNFDGIHRGHSFVFLSLVEAARERRLDPVVVSFFPHPREVLEGRESPGILTTPGEKSLLLREEFGLNLKVLPFTREFATLSALEYVRKILLGNLGMKLWLMGPDHRFGSGAGGQSENRVVREFLREQGIEVCILPEMQDLGTGIRSTSIRKLLADGKLKQANHLLGRPYELHGIVGKGDGIGRKIGFPTANLNFESPKKQWPKDGVYAAYADLVGRQYQAVVNFGSRPTVGGAEPRCEVHLLDFEGNIYSQKLRLKLHLRLRSEKAFPDVVELASRIDRDILEARTRLGN